MPLLAAMLSQAGEGAGVVAPAVPHVIPEPIPEPMPETDQPQDHLTAPPRQQPSDPIALVFEHGQSSDPAIASFSQVQETNDAPSTSTNMEDKPLGGSFHASPLRSTPASPAGHTSGGAEPLITLTALSSVVSTLVQRVNLLETELKDSKQLFKDVVEKLVKQVKAMEVKLKTKKRKVVVSDSDKEDGGEKDVDLDALHALANAAVTVMSLKSPGCPFTVSPGIKLSLPEALILPAAEPMPARVLLTTLLLHNQLQRCQKERLQAQELADLEKQRAESLMKDANLARQMSQDFEMTEDQRKRHKSSLLIKALLYTLLGWTIASISKTLSNLHPETASEEEFDKIQRAVAFTKGLKRDGSPMTNASSKKLKNGDVEVDVEAPSHGVPQEIEKLKSSFYEFPRETQQTAIQHPPKLANVTQEGYGTLKKKLLGRKGIDQCISRLHNSPQVLHQRLREILHLVTKADLMTIYGRVMTFYQDKKAEGVGLVLWGDLYILMDSPEVNAGSDFWKNQHTWSIQNWKLYSFSGVHVLETVSGTGITYVCGQRKYPHTYQTLIDVLLDHQLEICHGTVGNELTTAVQLIAFLKKQISDSKRPEVHEWVINSPCYHNKELASPEQTATAEVVPKSVAGSSFPAASSTRFMCSSQDSSRLVVAVKFIFQSSRYVVPTGKDNFIVSTGRPNMVPAGRTIVSPGSIIVGPG
ncbi:hypothetical protein Tco_1122457 [Tanacetum coccineum]|uniref:Uncharacterized protein n=1 Tax=Tanacetum coccineum TaxID=301880 RepID=A0ABQ5J0K4_9ASTR